jgi:two-component system CheB/CheR fusion protein
MMIQVTETTPFVLQSTAMNQALIESSVHQHELAQAAEKREETAVKEQERLAERVHITSEELDRSKGELRALAASLLTAQEAERQRIARDLHDNVAQRLAVIEMELAQLGQEAKRWEPRLSAVLSQVADVSTDIRQLSHDLHPTLLETFGLAVALRHLCQEWQRVAHLAIEYSSPPVTRPWPLPVGAALYRITQEALRNIKKHASGTRATVTLAENEQGIQLTIVDDGCGFNPTAVRHRGGMGLVSMHERVVTIHGLLEVQSRPGEGTTIRVAIPWQEEV